jgi:hypothetical protein
MWLETPEAPAASQRHPGRGPRWAVWVGFSRSMRYMYQVAKSSSQRVKQRRDKMRAMGMRPVQIWVPDTRAPGFAAEYQRQLRNIAEAETDESRAEDEAWFALSVEGLDGPP